jgi:hypothetical protein
MDGRGGQHYTDTYEVEVPYEWHILNISWTSRSFSDLISSRMDREQQEHFGVLMSTKSNRQYALNPFAGNWLPMSQAITAGGFIPSAGKRTTIRASTLECPPARKSSRP